MRYICQICGYVYDEAKEKTPFSFVRIAFVYGARRGCPCLNFRSSGTRSPVYLQKRLFRIAFPAKKGYDEETDTE